MFKGNVTVLDIGSSKITALVGGRGVNKTFSIKAVKSAAYSGYENGAFFDLNELKDAIINSVESVAQTCGKAIKSIYVGVPGEFVLVKKQNNLKAFSKRRKIKQKDINFVTAQSYNNFVSGYKIIKASPIYFTLGGHTKTIEPKGNIAENIDAYMSYFFCEEKFINIITGILAEAQIKFVRFLPVSLAQTLYLIAPEIRDNKVLLADIGYISSTVSEVLGNGILFQKAFSRGCGHIIAYLTEALDIDFDLADILLQKSNLGFNVKNKVNYEILYSDRLHKFSAEQVNSVITYGLDEICEYITLFIEKSATDADMVKLTGGGVFSIRGAAEYIARRVNINIEPCAPNLPYFNKPPHSSLISLLDAALTERETSYKSWRNNNV